MFLSSNYVGLRGLSSLQTASDIQFGLIFETSNLDYPGIHVHIASYSSFQGLRGHGGLQTASEVTSSLGFELSDLEYLLQDCFRGCPFGLLDVFSKCVSFETSRCASRYPLRRLPYPPK